MKCDRFENGKYIYLMSLSVDYYVVGCVLDGVCVKNAEVVCLYVEVK